MPAKRTIPSRKSAPAKIAEPIGKDTKLRAVDHFGERVLVVPASELAYSGNPIPVLLEREFATGTRLKDGENPVWFLRMHRQFEDMSTKRDGLTFSQWCERFHADRVAVKLY